jgi:hypothetical protein
VTLQGSLAIYAAVLSTILALSKQLPKGPIVVFEPVEDSDPPDCRLRIFNPSRRALFIDGCSQIRRAGPHENFGVVEERPLHKQEQIARAFRERLRWSPETGQVAKRESLLGTADRPKVRHDQYSEETRS